MTGQGPDSPGRMGIGPCGGSQPAAYKPRSASRDMAGRIEREIQYLQLLRHPHIIKLYEKVQIGANVHVVP